MKGADSAPDSGRSKAEKKPRQYRLPGYGWSAELSGLSRRREWLGFFLVTVAVLLVVIIGGYILQAVGVW